MNSLIKEINENEIAVCAEVVRKSFATVAFDIGITRENYPNDDGMFLTDEGLAVENQIGRLMVALYFENKIVGFMVIYDNENGVFGIGHLSVLPEYRHMGFGKSLLDYAKTKAEQSNGKKIEISIVEENTKLKKWYEQYGFIHKGTATFPELSFTIGYMELILNA